MNPPDAITATIWVLVDANGRYVADARPDNLEDEYGTDIAPPDLGQPLQLVRITARIPLPRPVELVIGAVVAVG